MKVAFIITRLSGFRLLGPVIDAALHAGWDVECWHDYGRPKVGLKGYLFPDVKAAPVFRYGQPVHRVYSGPGELSARLELCDVDAVVSTGTVESDTDGAPPRNYPTRICVQAMLDTFVKHSPETLERCDRVALLTPWWTDWAASYYASADRPLDVIALRARLARRVTHIGFPELDARAPPGPRCARRRWGIPANQPVVVLLPFPQGVGQGGFWPRRIFGESSRLRRMYHVASAGEFKYWRRALSDPSDADVVRAVRAFCDRNGAFLLVKSREKTPIPDYVRAMADRCVYDESYYPPTILEALSIAALCVSSYSASVLEAASVSVPNLCLTFSAQDYLGSGSPGRALFERFFNREEGGVFEFNGVSKTMTAEDLISELPNHSLEDFVVDQTARSAYVHKFIGVDDCQAASRLLEAIAVTVKTMSTADGSACSSDIPMKIPSLDVLETKVQDASQRVYIVSYPNAGRTWLRVMLSRYKQLLIGFDDFHVRLHAYHSSTPASPQYVFYHAESGAAPPLTLWGRLRGRRESDRRAFDLSACRESRVIFLLRDPRDLVVSNYHEVVTRQRLFKGTLSSFIRDARVGVDRIIAFSDYLYQQSQLLPVTPLWIQYEDMHRIPEGTLRRVCEFSGSAVVDAHICESVRFASRAHMQKLEADGALMRPMDDRALADFRVRKVRRGVVGGHRDELDEQDIAFIDGKIRTELPPFFHERPVSWLSRRGQPGT